MKSLKLIACLNVYDDAFFVSDCLNSIYNKVDRIEVVAGKYIGYDGETEDEATIKEISGFKDPLGKINVQVLPPMHQHEKRGRYLTGAEGDYYLRIDADEILLGYIDPIDLEREVYGIMLDRVDARSYPIPALFKHQEGMYYLTHPELVTKKGRVITTPEIAKANVYPHARIFHRRHERDEGRIKKKATYARRMHEVEGRIRKRREKKSQ